ncbi:MAG: hypothetical protein WD738_10220 [Pirellulales bacterium]
MAQTSAEGTLRAVIPKAADTPIVDGKLVEYSNAFCTPLEYFHPDLKNRAAQFFYLWDDEAFYVGVRTLDEKPFAPSKLFWTGDAVEWYFDTRGVTASDRSKWNTGAVHCFFTALELNELKPRFALRPGYENAIPEIAIEVAAQRTDRGLEYEFKLPWSNFPNYRAAATKTLYIDAELSYSDGISRSFRSFAFGSPLSVDQTANLARVMLVDTFRRTHWAAAGPVMMPMRVDTAWRQETEPRVHASIAMPPNRMADVGEVLFQLLDTNGQLIATYAAERNEIIEQQGNFVRRTAYWPNTIAAPGTYHVQAIVFDRSGKELTRVAPRLVSVNMDQGY